MVTSAEEQQIAQALNEGRVTDARALLGPALKESVPSAALYVMAAKAALNDTQRKSFLDQAIGLDPFNTEAFGMMERLTPPTPAAVPSRRFERPRLMHETVQLFVSEKWKLAVDTPASVRLEKRRAPNKWAEIAGILFLNGLGLLLVAGGRYCEKPVAFTLDDLGDGTVEIKDHSSHATKIVRTIADVAYWATAVKSPAIHFGWLVALWIIRDVIVAFLVS